MVSDASSIKDITKRLARLEARQVRMSEAMGHLMMLAIKAAGLAAQSDSDELDNLSNELRALVARIHNLIELNDGHTVADEGQSDE
ncbi:hypothetical protein AN189_12310 [Loktanella sp. 3ANDIMAR09]|uniref:hypothetical protein n=1 Tax=Loktanella sp. 3ANDIMAR09 TaxID=1225657 RepID=UPI0006F45C3D|nr:hypothetical protein [Loktanella sp. 3ANDIMAR09]KQI68170.1 hypothetical protein AN189_12310 [Loktanella sp. 3ANDIMAR09]